jgi:S-adenosylmethionine hydrolase
MVAPEFGKIVKEKKIFTGEILHVDAFGNVETKIAEKDIEGIGVSHGSSLKMRWRVREIEVVQDVW